MIKILKYSYKTRKLILYELYLIDDTVYIFRLLKVMGISSIGLSCCPIIKKTDKLWICDWISGLN